MSLMCPHRFPVLVGGRTFYVTCTLRALHDEPCQGVVRDI